MATYGNCKHILIRMYQLAQSLVNVKIQFWKYGLKARAVWVMVAMTRRRKPTHSTQQRTCRKKKSIWPFRLVSQKDSRAVTPSRWGSRSLFLDLSYSLFSHCLNIPMGRQISWDVKSNKPNQGSHLSLLLNWKF